MSNCILCGQRKARRHCLAAHGDICPQCCAQEREARFLCPFECPYLRDSRIHMRPPANAAAFAFPDVNVSLEFVKEYQPLYVFTAATLLTTAGDIPEVIDADVREAIESLVKTYQTEESGLIYGEIPANPLAAKIFGGFRERAAELRQALTADGAALRDSDIVRVLVFLIRYLDAANNGRPKCRAFADSLRIDMGIDVPKAEASRQSSLIVT